MNKEAPVVFSYIWPAMAGMSAVACYTLTAAIPGHGIKSTLSSKTFLAEGYSIPATELAKANAAMAKEVA